MSHFTSRAFLQQVIGTIDRYQLLAKGDTVVIGISGGPDSVALAEVFRRLVPRYRLTLHLAHLNHALRGRASDGDEQFIRRLAMEWEIPLSVARRETRKSRRPGESLEEVARNQRYAFFEEVAAHVGATKLAVGHHQDDQAETVLMRIMRGAGLEGLGGMAPSQKSPSVHRSRKLLTPSGSREGQTPFYTVIRPLLELTRVDIFEFLRATHLRWRKDASNEEMDFLRNKLRLKVLPFLARIQPAISRQLAQLGEVAREDEEYVNGVVKKLAARLWRQPAKKGEAQPANIRLVALRDCHLSLQRRLIRYGLKRVVGDLRGFGFTHVEAVRQACRDNVPRTVELPRGVKAVTGKGWLTLDKSG